MNPNAIVMTPEQLAVLKAEIIEEVRRESMTEPGSRYTVGNEIKKLTFPLFGSDYQVQSAIPALPGS